MFMINLRALKAWSRPWAAVLAAMLPCAGSPADNPSLLLMLKQDVGLTESRPLDPALLARLEQQAGFKLKWVGATRTNARVLTLPAGLNKGSAREVASRLATLNEVLWAEVDAPVTPAPARVARKTAWRAISAAAMAEAATIEEMVIKLRDANSRRPSKEVIDQLARAANAPLQLGWRAGGGGWRFLLPGPVTPDQAATMEAALESLPFVMYADPVRNRNVQGWVTPNDPDFPEQWYLQNVSQYPGSANVQAAWELTQGSPDVTVAVLDTGILFRPTHPDLAGRLTYLDPAGRSIAGWDMISRVWQARDGNRRDPRPTDQGDWVGSVLQSAHRKICEETGGSSWHGSHVAGIIGAASNNSIGVSGIDWHARVLPVRVMGACGGDLVDIVDGLYWALGDPWVRGTRVNAYPARIINLSLGSEDECSNIEQESIDYALSRNAVVVVAAGNEGVDSTQWAPGNCRGVITVSAVDKLGDLAVYSNHGGNISVAAPGGNTGALGNGTDTGMLSTANGSAKRPLAMAMNYRNYQGTSMSAPVVSGVIALMLAMDTQQRLTPQRIRTLLENTSRPFPAGSRCSGDLAGQCGAGIVDAYQAVKAVLDTP
ncbi:MAG: S8 family peptidase [Methylococcus sp.]